jgi:chromosome segregation ATPase
LDVCEAKLNDGDLLLVYHDPTAADSFDGALQTMRTGAAAQIEQLKRHGNAAVAQWMEDLFGGFEDILQRHRELLEAERELRAEQNRECHNRIDGLEKRMGEMQGQVKEVRRSLEEAPNRTELALREHIRDATAQLSSIENRVGYVAQEVQNIAHALEETKIIFRRYVPPPRG